MSAPPRGCRPPRLRSVLLWGYYFGPPHLLNFARSPPGYDRTYVLLVNRLGVLNNTPDTPHAYQYL